MFKRDLGIGAVLGIVFAIVLAVNLIGAIALDRIKIDMTEDKLYTLSPGSKKMLGKLDDDVKIKVYYSKRAASAAPAIKQYGERVIEMMKQFQANSGGKLKLEVVNPLPDTEDEEWAQKYGLKPLQAQEPLYFGLVAIGEGGAEQSVPFLDPQREGFLEYDTARIIAAVSHPKKKKVGILSTLPVTGAPGNDPMARMQGKQPQPSWVFVEELRRSYDVVDVPTTAATIDDSIDLLLVIHPKNLSEQTEYAIDQFVLKGKNTVILADPSCEFEMKNFKDPNPQGRFQASFESDLPKLFEAWGISIEKGKVVGDITTGANVNTQQGVKQYIVWMLLKGDGVFNKEDLTTSGLEQMTFASAGQIKKRDGAKYTVTPLIQTPPTAKLVDSFILKLGADPDELAKDYKPGNEKLNLAVKITGKFETAFPGGKPTSALPRKPGEGEADKKEDEKDAPHLAKAEKDANVIVVSDVDTISDDFAVQVQNMFGRRVVTTPYDNLNFFFNEFEQLTGSEDLISLRTRGKSSRPFTVVDNIEAKASAKWKDKEDELRKKVEEANTKLQELQGGRGAGDQAVLSAAQMEEIEKFKAVRAATNKELRVVKRSLREDIESLGAWLKFLNIALMPVLVTLLAFVPSWWRNYKIKESRG